MPVPLLRRRPAGRRSVSPRRSATPRGCPRAAKPSSPANSLKSTRSSSMSAPTSRSNTSPPRPRGRVDLRPRRRPSLRPIGRSSARQTRRRSPLRRAAISRVDGGSGSGPFRGRMPGARPRTLRPTPQTTRRERMRRTRYICFCGNWSLVVTGNVIASCGPRAAAPIALNTTEMLNLNGASSLIPSGVGTELAFPITVGIKYNF